MKTFKTPQEIAAIMDNRKETERRNTLALQTNENLFIDGKKSIFAAMVLRLMDSDEYANNYCGSLSLVAGLFPELDADLLEKELDKYI